MFSLLNIFSKKSIDSGGALIEKYDISVYKKNYNRFEEKTYDDLNPFSVNNKVHFLNEVKYLELLEQYDITPKIIEKNENALILTDCGNVLNISNLPQNWKEQITNIYLILKKEQIYHNDIKIDNFTVKDGKIFLIDFGWASQFTPSYPYLNINLNIIEKSTTTNQLFHCIYNHSSQMVLNTCVNLNNYINNRLRNT